MGKRNHRPTRTRIKPTQKKTAKRDHKNKLYPPYTSGAGPPTLRRSKTGEAKKTREVSICKPYRHQSTLGETTNEQQSTQSSQNRNPIIEIFPQDTQTPKEDSSNNEPPTVPIKRTIAEIPAPDKRTRQEPKPITLKDGTIGTGGRKKGQCATDPRQS